MAVRKYTKQEFIRSAIVVGATIAAILVYIMWYGAKTNQDVFNNVKESSKYLTEQIAKQLNADFAVIEVPNLVLKRNMISPQNLNKFVGDDKKELAPLSVESVSIWTKDEEGEIVSAVHTITKFTKKNLYGLDTHEELNKKNVKDYFKLKIENEWIKTNYDKISEYEIEDLNHVIKNKTRDTIHAVRKFDLKGKTYLIDIQYSKKSIAETRITKTVQKRIVEILFFYMIFLAVYSFIFDKNLLTHILVFYVLIFTLYPITWVISLTFQTSNSLGGTTLNPIPKNPTLNNYKAAVFNLKNIKLDGIVMEDNGRLFLLDEIKQEKKGVKPKIEKKNLKTIYNVFDPNQTNLLKQGKAKFTVEEKEEITTYNNEEKKLVKMAYYIDLDYDKNISKDMQIYNVEYYTYQNMLFLSGITNSIFVAIATSFIGMLLSSAAAYAFSRFRFPGRDGFMMSFLVTQMFPGTMMLIPLYIIFSNLGFINTFRGLILAYSITALPFNIWNLKGFFDTIPKDLEEAALIDGCSASQTFYIIVLPLSLPALAISGLFSFMGAWNEYIMAATFMNNEGRYTIPVVIRMLVGSNSVDWPMFGTMSVLVSIPVVAVFIMTQKYLVGGLTAGGVKG